MYLDNNFSEYSKLPKLRRQAMTIRFEKALGLLPAGYRHVFILRDVCGYGNKQVAKMLRITEGTCTSHLFRARNALIWLLPELYPFPPGQFLEWSKNQLKIFRGAYANPVMPGKNCKIFNDDYQHDTIPNRGQVECNFDFH